MTHPTPPPAPAEPPGGARWAHAAYAVAYRIIAALFACCALLLVGFSGLELSQRRTGR